MPKTQETFKAYREHLNLSQKEIAEELNTTQSVISKIENGKLYGVYFVKYLKFLSKKGIDMNHFLDHIKL